MTAIDLTALTRASTQGVTLASGIVSQSGTGTDYTGWSDVSSIYLAAKCTLRDGSRGFARIVMTVEESANGISWSPLQAFTFGAGGSGAEQTATVTPTQDHVRASWATTGSGEWQIVYVTATPSVINDPTAGGGLPDEWTVDTDGGLVIALSDTDGALIVQLDEDVDSSVTLSVAGDGTDNSSLVKASAKGEGSGQITANYAGVNGGVTLDARGGLSLFTRAGFKGIDAWDQDGNTLRFALLPTDGQPMIGVTSAPSDGDLSASQVALWFDDTNGAAKLMIKGKSADGSVITGDAAGGLGAKLYDFTVGTAQAAIDTFVDDGGHGVGASLSQDYDLLSVYILGRTAQANANSAYHMIVNNDTGAHYDKEVLQATDGGTSIFNVEAEASWGFFMRGDSGTANYASLTRISFLGYAETVFFKTGEVTSALPNGATANTTTVEAVGWRSTAAITRLKITGDANFMTGTRLVVFGL